MPSISAPKTGTSLRPVRTSDWPLRRCVMRRKSFVEGAEDEVRGLVAGQRAVGDAAGAGQQQRAEAAHAPFGRQRGGELAGRLAAFDQRPQRVAEDAAAVRERLGVGGRADLGERIALGHVQPGGAQPPQGVGGAALVQPARQQRLLALPDGLRLDRGDQRLARREVAVDGRAADARRRRDLRHPDVRVLAQQPRRHLDDAVDVAGGVRAEVFDGASHGTQQRSR